VDGVDHEVVMAGYPTCLPVDRDLCALLGGGHDCAVMVLWKNREQQQKSTCRLSWVGDGFTTVLIAEALCLLFNHKRHSPLGATYSMTSAGSDHLRRRNLDITLPTWRLGTWKFRE